MALILKEPLTSTLQCICVYANFTYRTIDAAERNGSRERYRTFKWFAISPIYYFCDFALVSVMVKSTTQICILSNSYLHRQAMHFNHGFGTNVTSFTAMTDHDGSRMINLKAKRPILFQFHPGQHVRLRIREIDRTWHPFTLASAPDSSSV